MSWFRRPRLDDDGDEPVIVPTVPPLPVGYATCDRCGAIAWYRVVVNAARGWFLDFCYHHFQYHEVAFRVNGYEWEDQSKQIPGRMFDESIG